MKTTLPNFVLALATAVASTATAGTYEAFTEPLKTIEIAAPEAGVIQSLPVEEGQYIQCGETIAELDRAVLATALEVARSKAETKGSLDAARASVNQQQKRHEQLVLLLKQGHANPEEVEQSRTDMEIANANHLSVQEEVRLHQLEAKQIEAQIKRRLISSPVDGTVVRLHKEVGEAVAGGDSGIATIVQLQQLAAKLYLPTEVAMVLKLGQALPIQFPATNSDTTGVVSFISPVTDASSGTVRVEIRIDNPQNKFRSGVRCVYKTS